MGPVLVGLGLAYALSGFAEYKVPGQAMPTVHETAVMHTGMERASLGDAILKKNILGLEIPAAPSKAGSREPVTELENWKLLGTSTGKRSLALVSVNGQSNLLAVGESLQGWELSEIQPQSTQWKSGGKTLTLTMWPGEDVSEPSSTSTSHRANLMIDHNDGHAGSRRVTLSRSEIQPFLNDANSLLQMAQFMPYSRPGEMSGFQVNRIRQDSMLHKLGLKNGDVLTRIDGRAIAGPTELLQAYSSLGQSTLVTVDVIREGRNVSFLVEIE